MKRILSSLLLMVFLITLCPTTVHAAAEMTDSQITQITQNMLNHIINRDYTLLVDDKYRQYPSFIEDLHSNTYATATIELINELIDTGGV